MIVLGISIGTRNVGLAVIKHRKLVDYRIRTFPGKWTPQKCRAIVTIVSTLAESNAVTDLTIKIPDMAHCSENTCMLIDEIQAYATRWKLQTHFCTLQDLVGFYFANRRTNKDKMIAVLIERYPYPDLARQWKGGKKGRLYNAKLFEAIACAELALRAGH